MMKIENTFFIVCVIDRFEIRCISFFYGQPFTQMEYIPSKKKKNSIPIHFILITCSLVSWIRWKP